MLELVQLSIGYMLVDIELQICINQNFYSGQTIALATMGVDHWATYPKCLFT